MARVPATEVRTAKAEDVPAMVALSSAKRRAYAAVLPLFWRPASDADVRQRAWFLGLLARESTITLVADDGQGTAGFLLGLLHAAPPVYEPGGLTLTVDDFCVREESQWATVGAALLSQARQSARSRGAAQVVVVCGDHDRAKRAALDAAGLAPASIWLTGRV